MRSFVERASLLLLALNAMFLIWVTATVATHWTTWTASVELPAEDTALGPAKHLPLAGMGGVSYPAEQACLRLNGFLMEMVRSLAGGVPVSSEEIQAVVASGQCSVNDPDVRTLIVAFREAYQQAGLTPLSPFLLMDTPPAPNQKGPDGPAGPPTGGPGGPPTGGPGGPPTGGPGEPPHALSDMFSIAGMPDYTAGPEQACPTLARLLDVMDRKLHEAGGEPPLEGPHRDRLLTGSCSLEDPTLAATLGSYRDAFARQGVRPLPPFTFFGVPSGGSASPPPPKGKQPQQRGQGDGPPPDQPRRPPTPEPGSQR